MKEMFRFTKEAAKSPDKMKEFINGKYEELAIILPTRKKKYEYKNWADMTKSKGIFNNPALCDDQWNLVVTRPGSSQYVEKHDVTKLVPDKDGIYHTKVVKTYWRPVPNKDGRTEYYTQERLPFWEAIKHLRTLGDEASAIAEEFREAYYLYKFAYMKAARRDALYFEAAANVIMTEAFRKYEEASKKLYAYNAQFRDLAGDVRITVRDLNFELESKQSTYQEYDTVGLAKAVYAAAVFDCGNLSEELEVLNKHPEMYTFLERCLIPELGVAGYTDFGNPIYHKPLPGVKYPMFSAVGRKQVEINKADTINKLIECYDFYMSLSELDREPYYRRWVDAKQVTHVVRNLDDYMEYKYPDDKTVPQLRDFLTALYDEDDDDAPTNNKRGKYVNAEASVMGILDPEEDNDLIDITDMVVWVGDEDTETPQVTVCGKALW